MFLSAQTTVHKKAKRRIKIASIPFDLYLLLLHTVSIRPIKVISINLVPSCIFIFKHLSTSHISYMHHRSTNMRFNDSFKLYATVYGVALATVSEVAARIIGPADIRENIKVNKSIVKNKGEECIKLEADIPKNEKGTENVDIGVLGCAEALICLEDDSSSTGARCVDFVEEIRPFSDEPNRLCRNGNSICVYPGTGDNFGTGCCNGYKCEFSEAFGQSVCVDDPCPKLCGKYGSTEGFPACCEGYICVALGYPNMICLDKSFKPPSKE